MIRIIWSRDPTDWDRPTCGGRSCRRTWPSGCRASEKISDHEEIVHVDGKSFKRDLPRVATKKDPTTGRPIIELNMRPPGAHDMRERLKDHDEEGIWGEAMYGSLGLWEHMIEDRELVRVASHAVNEWILSDIQNVAPDRFVPGASLPLLNVQDAVTELEHAASIGLHLASLPTGVPNGMPDWNADDLGAPVGHRRGCRHGVGLPHRH